MGQSLNLVRRNSADHLRLRVPADLRASLGRTEVKHSLGNLPYEEAHLAALCASDRNRR